MLGITGDVPHVDGDTQPIDAGRMPDTTGGRRSRQRVVRVRGARRARLTPAPGTIAEPAEPSALDTGAPAPQGGSGPNDERLRQDVPPHY